MRFRSSLPLGRLEVGLVALSVVGIAIGLVLELTCGGVRGFLAERPITSGVLLGLLLVSPLLLAIERGLNRRERRIARVTERFDKERWRDPAIDAIETFLFTSDAITTELNEFILDALDELGGGREGDLNGHLRRLATEQPAWYSELYRFLQDAGNRLGLVGIGATQTIALYPALSSFVGDVSKQQRMLREMAEATGAVTFLGADVDEVSVRHVKRAADRINDLAFKRMHGLFDLKMRLADLPEEIEVSELVDLEQLARSAPTEGQRTRYQEQLDALRQRLRDELN